MSRTISEAKIAAEELTWDEAVYLQKRDKLPKGYPMPDPPDVDDVRPAAPSKYTPLEDQTQILIENQGGIVDDEEPEEYEDGWNNDQRRAALSERGLNVEGRKDDLIARLLRSDAQMLNDDDYTTVG